jgi:hypothetical protein
MNRHRPIGSNAVRREMAVFLWVAVSALVESAVILLLMLMLL